MQLVISPSSTLQIEAVILLLRAKEIRHVNCKFQKFIVLSRLPICLVKENNVNLVKRIYSQLLLITFLTFLKYLNKY